MFLSTCPIIEGYKISNHHFISVEVVIWANAFKDLFASFTNFFGGRSTSYEKALIEWKNKAMDELITKATTLGANGIIWIDLSYNAIGRKWSMFMINITWTAVVMTSA